MCGIVAYLGKATARDIMLGGLSRLEYRGYDSAGLAVIGLAPDGQKPAESSCSSEGVQESK